MNKVLKVLKNPLWIIIGLDQIGIHILNDEKFLKLKYKLYFNKKLNLNTPVTFSEKLQWLKLYDKNELYKTMVDKITVKDYVTNIIGKQYIIPTIGVYDSFDDIEFDKLPDNFVIKCNHHGGGNGVIICRDKNQFNIKAAKKSINKVLKRNLFYYGREWPYKEIKPKIIIEKYIGISDEPLKDYKLMCFNGDVKCSFVCDERFSEDGLKVTFFNNNWEKLPFERHYPSSNKQIKKPINFEKMIELAEDLSKNIPFIRVDFYEVKGKIYFGELTLYPGSGFEEFNPEEWDRKLGDWLELPK